MEGPQALIVPVADRRSPVTERRIESVVAPEEDPTPLAEREPEGALRESPPEFTLRTSRKFALGLLGVAVSQLAMGVSMIVEGFWLGWPALILAGYLVWAAIHELTPRRSSLTVNAHGLVIRTMFQRDKRIAWSTIDSFGTSSRFGNKWVGIRLKPAETANHAARRRQPKFDLMLPSIFKLPPDTLAELLPQCRERWLRIAVTDTERN